MVQVAYIIDNDAEEKPNSVGKDDDKRSKSFRVNGVNNSDSGQRTYSLEEAIEEARKYQSNQLFYTQIFTIFHFLLRTRTLRNWKVSNGANILDKFVSPRVID